MILSAPSETPLTRRLTLTLEIPLFLSSAWDAEGCDPAGRGAWMVASMKFSSLKRPLRCGVSEGGGGGGADRRYETQLIPVVRRALTCWREVLRVVVCSVMTLVEFGL